jgi:periplasmic protein TorT
MSSRSGKVTLILLAIAMVMELLPCTIEVPRIQAQAQAQEIKPWWPRGFWVITTYGERRRMELTAAKAAKKYTIGVTYPAFNSPYQVSCAYGNAQQAKWAGVKVILKCANGYEDLNGQISQVENFVQQGVDAIILGPISGEGNAPSALAAQKKGIPVILNGQHLSTHDYSALSCQDLYDLGVTNGQWLLKKTGGKAKIAFIPGPSGISWTELWYQGVLYALKDAPGIKVAATRWCPPSVTEGQSITENLLQTFPDLDYILTSDLMSIGACNAIEARKSKTKVVMDFGMEANLPYIKRGTIAMCIAGSPVMDGLIALDLAVRVLNNEKDRPWIVNSDPVIITPENVDKIDRSVLWAPKGWQVPAIVE